MKQFSRFLQRLKDTPDKMGEPLLDSTIVLFEVVWVTRVLIRRNLPIMLAGGGFQHGQHHRFERTGYDGRPLSNLFVTILHQLGVEQDDFSTSSGNLDNLLI